MGENYKPGQVVKNSFNYVECVNCYQRIFLCFDVDKKIFVAMCEKCNIFSEIKDINIQVKDAEKN